MFVNLENSIISNKLEKNKEIKNGFLDKENNTFYRYNYIFKGVDKPLIVYLPGSASAGLDGFRQYFEFLLKFGFPKKYDANLLIIQPNNPFYQTLLKADYQGFEKYVDSYKSLIESITKKYNLSSDKIFCLGTSLGAYCVWQFIYKYPTFFAGVISVAGEFDISKKLNAEKYDFSRYLSTPIWIVHATNDKSVPIAPDDYAYDKLKSMGAKIKYTRLSKYGHQISNRFYRRENWFDWLMEEK